MKCKLQPSISIIMPTYNSERTLPLCLERIAAQNFPREKIELIIIDGGSRDHTLEIAKEFKADKILNNPLRTGESGKAIGVRAASNEIIALIDSDNILPSNEWLSEMVKPFEDDQIAGSEPIKFQFISNDTLINRYCALTGVNDPICLFIGNYPYFNYITKKWTEIKHVSEDRGNYLAVQFLHETPAAGANGFLIRRNVLLPILKNNNYLFDVDVFRAAFSNSKNYFAKVYIGIVHKYCENVQMFINKQRRRIKDYLFYRTIRNFPLKTNYFSLAKFVISTVLLFPVTLQTIIGLIHKKDSAWLFHVPACYLTLIIYAFESIKVLFKMSQKSMDVSH